MSLAHVCDGPLIAKIQYICMRRACTDTHTHAWTKKQRETEGTLNRDRTKKRTIEGEGTAGLDGFRDDNSLCFLDLVHWVLFCVLLSSFYRLSCWYCSKTKTQSQIRNYGILKVVTGVVGNDTDVIATSTQPKWDKKTGCRKVIENETYCSGSQWFVLQTWRGDMRGIKNRGNRLPGVEPRSEATTPAEWFWW